jgi:2-polyprenyl-6-hydroxyphenyl methylase/3-demethylubiquinone-9 3-methyltransferase
MNSTIEPAELVKFAQHASAWWDCQGPLKTLHDINPTRLAYILEYCPIQNMRILDVGCGGGILTEALAREGAHAIGLDAEVHAIDAAREHANYSNLSIDYVCSAIEVYDAPEFDCITCMELLEHVSDFSLVIHHAARLLKRDGYLFLSTLNRTVKSYLTAIVAAEYLFSLLPRQTHDFSQLIRPSELARTLRDEGFEIVNMRGMHYNPFTRKAMLCESVDVNYLLVAQRIY